MVARESVRARMEGEHGISFTEFSYMLLQANDFRHLHAAYGVEIQGGGSDQWGNIVSGVDLIRRTSGSTAHAVTWPLVTRSDGAKMGKSAAGADQIDSANSAEAPKRDSITPLFRLAYANPYPRDAVGRGSVANSCNVTVGFAVE